MSIKLALLSNYTVDYLKKPLLEKLKPLDGSIYIAGYNQFRQEILDNSSGLYSFKPDIVFLMLQADNLFPDIYSSYMKLTKDAKNTAIENLSMELKQLANKIYENLGAVVVINNFVAPFHTALDILDTKTEYGLKEFIGRLNIRLYELSQQDRFFIFDYNGFISYNGFINVFEHKMYYLAKTYEQRAYLNALSNEYMRYISGFMGTRKKCIVLDLDNTLWGGIAGEDGIEGIKLSNDGQGKAYYDFQKALLNLHDKGILLTICSKNNEEDALNIINKHPDMILRKEHFAVIKANWENKAQNIEQIAAELNIGLDSIVFMDDNPFEREQVKLFLPDVTVIEMPEDAALYTKTLNEQYFFSSLSITEEDLKRNKQYLENAQRTEELTKYSNVDDYLKTLEMELIFYNADDFNINRIHQLINKTNQFNMTTKRYTLEELKRFMQDPSKSVKCCALKDKFGDNGIIGVIILDFNENICNLDTFLLSCRVLGRKVDTAVLNHIVESCKKIGITELNGEFIPTQKNIANKNVYSDYGFKSGEGNIFTLELKDHNQNNMVNFIKIMVGE